MPHITVEGFRAAINRCHQNLDKSQLEDFKICPVTCMFFQHHEYLDTFNKMLKWSYNKYGCVYIKGLRFATESSRYVDLEMKPKRYQRGWWDGKQIMTHILKGKFVE